ncbi:MAG: aldose 1-epimerase family protein [Williamsia sp.]|nr:aldose 1-epimerase family protein [Williamsia sp.]
MQTIYNDVLTVTINPKGAELSSIYHKQHELEYLWSADPAYWAKKSPVLFPIVGALKDNTFFFNDKPYELSRHGFARESTFTVSEQSQDAIAFTLTSDGHTLTIYPFHFEFSLHYALAGEQLQVTYGVKNLTGDDMYFSVGGHPAFKVPLAEGTDYTDYYLEFNQPENVARWPIAPDGRIEAAPVPMLNNTNKLPLTKELFWEDALVFKHLASNKVALKSDKTEHGLEMDFSGFPYLGIWAAKGADFVCLEPWCGIADSVNTNQQLIDKEGINRLAAHETFTRTWSLNFF